MIETDSAAFLEAVRALQNRQPLDAERIVTENAKQMEETHGEQSAERASALFDLAKILLAVSDFGRAADALRVACQIRPTGEQATRDRLTYIMNLGEILRRSGAIEEAESILREGLSERESFYGREHPGYAFGLEPLADVVYARGNVAEAAELINEAVGTLWNAGHERVAQVFGIRAFIVKAVGEPAFNQTDGLPEALFDEMARTVMQRASEEPDEVALGVLSDLVQETVALRGSKAELLIQVHSTLSNVARAIGNHEQRIASLEWLRDALGLTDPLQSLDVAQALALANDDAGNTQMAEQTYIEALARAKGLGGAHAANVLRNFALFLSSHDRTEEADEKFKQSISAAAGDKEMLARSKIAHGIFHQHEGDLEQAKKLLLEGIASLDPSNPDTLYARSHLDAIETGGSCGCGDMSGAIGEALQAMVMDQLPEGLLEAVELAKDESGEAQIRVSLARDPTEEEIEHLDRVIHQATAELQSRIRDES